MKKFILFLITAMFAICANAQIMRAEELEKFAKEKYGEKWVEAAENIKPLVSLDKNNSLVYSQVVECPGKSKADLYILLNYWYSNTFNDANSVIQLNDKELGCIIGKGYVDKIAEHVGGSNTYYVNIKPIIKTDIKEGKVRITYTITSYDADVLVGGGILGALGGAVPKHSSETWALETCYPFASKDKHKKTSCKALVIAYAYSNVIMDKIVEAVKNGMNGNDGNDW